MKSAKRNGRSSHAPLGGAIRSLVFCCAAGISADAADAPASAIGKLYLGSADLTGEQTISRHIASAAYADRWPLTAAAATVVCVLPRRLETLMLVIDGRAWALNGATRKLAESGLEIEIADQRVPVDASADQVSWRLREPDDLTMFKSMMPVIDAASRIGCLRKGETGGID